MINDKTLYLQDGSHFPWDAVLCGTGWKLGVEFFGDDLELDLLHKKEIKPHEVTAKWKPLTMEADERLREKYPLLTNPPNHFHKNIDTTPYRLDNGVAPLSDDSILFIYHITGGNKIFAAEDQAIWAVAYFDKGLILPLMEEREKKIANWVASDTSNKKRSVFKISIC
ncbi:uncharacterized protein EAE98_011488 [Botrytis deweyae]|uniref:Uncharacterized protein n=1 Tax=Botrytis deweyae TaxID=2478750 RepID=A0ABQ7I5I1_9HELO|nr:uncharacterized protein EAE98_011488 [Botrytis deweyae]KAF7913463.1 hypothetical protein EAE98_011488 [Botrytis deweyae]